MYSDSGIFTVGYLDGTNFIGNLFSKDWNKIENKPISEIIFVFADNVVKLQEFNEYNLTIENIAIVGKTAPMINNITFAGRDNEKSTLYIFDFKTKHLVKKITHLNKEYGNLTSNTWKSGIINGKAKDYIL